MRSLSILLWALALTTYLDLAQTQGSQSLGSNRRLQNAAVVQSSRPQNRRVVNNPANIRPQSVMPPQQPQAQQLLPPGHPNIVPPRKGQAAVKPGVLATRAPPKLMEIASQMTYKSVTLEQIDKVFSKKEWAYRLTDCLVNIGYCNVPFGLDLFQRIDAASKGGEMCPGCTRAEAIQQLQAIVRTVSIYQRFYPQQWKRIEDKLLFLDERI